MTSLLRGHYESITGVKNGGPAVPITGAEELREQIATAMLDLESSLSSFRISQALLPPAQRLRRQTNQVLLPGSFRVGLGRARLGLTAGGLTATPPHRRMPRIKRLPRGRASCRIVSMSSRLPADDPRSAPSGHDPTQPHERSKLVAALRGRLVVAGATWALVTLGHELGGIFPGISAMHVTLAVVLASHLAATALAPRSPSRVWLSISLLDSLLLAGLLFYLGGGNSPLLPLLLLQVFATALFASGSFAVLVAILDVLLVVGLSVGEVAGWWQPWPVVPGPAPTPAMLQASIVARVLLWGVYLVTSATISGFTAVLVRRVERAGLVHSIKELSALRRISWGRATDRSLAEVISTVLEGAQQTLEAPLAALVASETPEGPVRLFLAADADRGHLTRLFGAPPESLPLPPPAELRRRVEALVGGEPLGILREWHEVLALLGLGVKPEEARQAQRASQSELYALVPLRPEGTVVGVMLLGLSRPTLRPAEVQSVHLFANEAGQALFVAHLRQARNSLTVVLQQRNAQLARILALNNELRLDLALDNLLQRVADGIRDALDIEKVILSLLADEGQLRTAAWSGRGLHKPPPMTTSIDRRLLRPDNRISRSYLLRAADSNSVLRPGDRWGPQDRLIVPIEARGRLIGYLSLGAPASGHVPHRSMIEMIEIMAGQAGLAIQNARLYQAMVEERARLNAILAGSAEPIIALDARRRIRLLNEAAERALGVQAEEALDRPLAESGLSRTLRAAIASTRAVIEPVTSEVTLEDGRTFAMAVAPLDDAAGSEPRGWVVTLHDITHLKELDRLKGEFVSTVSHDLRAPLTTITGYTFLLHSEPLSESGQSALEQIELAVARMTRLISDLLDLGRIESGVGFNPQPLEVGELLTAVRQELQPLATGKGLRLVLRTASQLPPIEADSDRLHQAVGNLVQNAIKFTPGGGEVAIQAERVGPNLMLTISDTGIGIPAADLPYIFDRFYRVGRRAANGDQQADGSGLGLAIAKSIVERHGGRIGVESRPGVGTTFRITLPALTSPVSSERIPTL